MDTEQAAKSARWLADVIEKHGMVEEGNCDIEVHTNPDDCFISLTFRTHYLTPQEYSKLREILQR